MEKEITRLIEIVCYHYQDYSQRTKVMIEITPENILSASNPMPEIRGLVCVIANSILKYSVIDTEAIFNKKHPYLIHYRDRVIPNMLETDKRFKIKYDIIINEFKDYLEELKTLNYSSEIIKEMGILIVNI